MLRLLTVESQTDAVVTSGIGAPAFTCHKVATFPRKTALLQTDLIFRGPVIKSPASYKG